MTIVSRTQLPPAPKKLPNTNGLILIRRSSVGITVAEFAQLLKSDSGQDVAEYAVMLAVILVVVVATLRLVGLATLDVFSTINSQLQQ